MKESKLDETIRGIEYCMSSNAPDDCEHCPGQYICGDSIMQENFVDLPKSMVNNALELLKEQAEQIAMMKMIYGSDAKVVGEIIRCKNCCFYRQSETIARNNCSLHGSRCDDEDFCSWAVKKK